MYVSHILAGDISVVIIIACIYMYVRYKAWIRTLHGWNCAKSGYTLHADNPWIHGLFHANSARASAIPRTRTYVRGIVRDIELCDQLASHSDTLQKRRPWLTEKRSRTIYIRDTLRTVLVHRILPVSCPYK